MTRLTLTCAACGTAGQTPGGICTECGATVPAIAAVKSRSRRRILWRVTVILLALALFVGAVAGAGYAGLYYGERDREAQRQSTLDEHYQNGLIALNNGDFERAQAHFQYVLQLDPGNTLAAQGLAEAQARLVVKPTPTSEAVQSLTEILFEQARSAYSAKSWTDAASTLTQLRALDQEYRASEVEAMLFESLYNAGMAFLDQNQLEEGIFYLDQAVALRPLDADAANQRSLAARYRSALRFWGVDWERAIAELEALYATTPGYKDVFERIYNANIEYGDYLSSVGEMCPAEVVYTKALLLVSTASVEGKRALAAQTCLIATPVPQDGALPVLTPQAIPGFTVGRLAYPVYNASTGVYDLYALYADGKILSVASSADQPWWEWFTGRVIYRDRLNRTIAMVLPEEGVPQQLYAPDGRAWPTLSRDGQRIAFAMADANGNWSIYVANTYGGSEAKLLGLGWAPSWGPTGQLAYTGCDATGCGIIIDNPDDDQPGVRLTASSDDSAVSWAPGGNLLAYMTNVTGNWDVMLLDISGGVAQLTYEASDEGLPVWAPDGSGVAFLSNRDGKWAIYIVDPNGMNPRRILDLGIDMPGWQQQRLSWAP